VAARKRLGEILIQAGVLGEPQLRAALTEQRRWGGPIGRILVDMKLITEDAMVQALSHQLNLPAVSLDQRIIAPEVLDLVPGELAEQLSVLPFAVQGKFLDLAMVDPTNISAIDTLRTRTRLNVRPYLAGPKSVERALARHYGRGVSGPVGFQTGPAFAVQEDQVTPMGSLTPSGSMSPVKRDTREVAEVTARVAELRSRIERLEAFVTRDEDVLRKLLAVLVE
jgi:type IV pilus assembly protein PilB